MENIGNKITIAALVVLAIGAFMFIKSYDQNTIKQMERSHAGEMAECWQDAAKYGGSCEYEVKTDRQGTPLDVEVVRK